MSLSKHRKVFLNMSVKNLDKTKAFFTALGFEFDTKYTDQNAACMIISDQAWVMLLAEEFFKTFTTRELCDRNNRTEMLVALACESRDEVNQLVHKAIAAGGSHAVPPQDHGFMYSWSFYDLDGHHWEVFYMDEAALAAQSN